MERRLYKILFLVLILMGIFILLNMRVTTRQGIDYKWSSIKIPLYLKVLDFFDRHYNYIELVKRIVKDAKTDEEHVMKIFEWTYKNIKPNPKEIPVIDDHAWHIIVRGCGANDQSCDVFTTLCNYAGIDAFYNIVYTKDYLSSLPLSFVRLDKKWRVFDPYNGVYFKNKSGEIASTEQIKDGNWVVENIADIEKLDFDYKKYIINLPIIRNIGLTRANIQSPLKRFLFEIKKHLK